MKYIVLPLLFISVSVFGKKIPGYYINLQGDTVTTVFKVNTGLFGGSPTDVSMQRGIKTFIKGKKLKLKPEMVKEIGFTYKGESFVMHAITDPILSDLNCLQINLEYYSYGC